MFPGRIARAVALLGAVARRQIYAREEAARALLWGNDLAYELQPLSSTVAVRVDHTSFPSQPPAPNLPATTAVGVVTAGNGTADPVLSAASFYGLAPSVAMAAGLGQLLAQALREAWPVVALSGAVTLDEAASCHELLRTYVRSGGTLFVYDATPRTNPLLSTLGYMLTLDLPACVDVEGHAKQVVFPAETACFAREFAGVRMDVPGARYGFAGGSGGRPLALLCEPATVSAVVAFRCGRGSMVLATEHGAMDPVLHRAYGPRTALSLLPAFMLLRRAYGDAVWHPPVRLANFTIDDPALRFGRLGLNYVRAVHLAMDARFHVTIATVPVELPLAEPEVLRLLTREREFVSACYHGNTHAGYEFYDDQARHHRFRRRPLFRQRQAIWEAAARGSRFAAETGYELDKVMVFPHGIGPAAVLPMLAEAGFMATFNAYRRPLGRAVEPPPDSGLRPADLDWHGYPVMWRRWVEDPLYPFDLFIGRPVVTATHANGGDPLAALAERALALNGLAPGQICWSGLATIARHAYLQRHDPRDGWQVWMMARDACLHNPSATTRTYRVARPHQPPGTRLATSGPATCEQDALRVSVPPGGSTRVWLADSGGACHPRPSPCPIMAPAR